MITKMKVERMRRGYSVREFMNLLRLSRASVYNWESRRAAVPMRRQGEVARILGVKPECLFDGDGVALPLVEDEAV